MDDDVNDDVNDDDYESSSSENSLLNRREMMFKTKSFALTLGLSSFVALKDDKAQAFTEPHLGSTCSSIPSWVQFLRPSSWVEVKGSGNDIFTATRGMWRRTASWRFPRRRRTCTHQSETSGRRRKPRRRY